MNKQLPQPFEVPLTYPQEALKDKDPTLEHAIQENLLCLQSLKHGFFTDANRVRRLSLCRGDGQFVQCGGNKVSNSHGFGFNMSELISGS